MIQIFIFVRYLDEILLPLSSKYIYCIRKMTKNISKPSKNAILLMHCPDQSGIVAVVTDFININGGNILYLDQYVDRENRIPKV